MSSRLLSFVVALVFSALVATLAHAGSLGVVLIHGKEGQGGGFGTMSDAMNQAGWLTERPEMGWSKRRICDKPYLDCLAEIDAAIARLRERGATDIVILGMSLGGNGVLGYGARHDNLKGIIALAPAHAP